MPSQRQCVCVCVCVFESENVSVCVNVFHAASELGKQLWRLPMAVYQLRVLLSAADCVCVCVCVWLPMAVYQLRVLLALGNMGSGPE